MAAIDGEYAEVEIPFGKYKGQQLGDLPESYMRWCLDQEWFHTQYPSLVTAMEHELQFKNR